MAKIIGKEAVQVSCSSERELFLRDLQNFHETRG